MRILQGNIFTSPRSSCEGPAISGKKVIKILKKFGFGYVRTSGDHVRLIKKTPEKTYKIIVPLHDPLKRKTFLSILHAAELTLEEFLDKK
ncbi:MAG: type II toxin-antitoxin system HicA family toxin [Promethearchaeota archaeon]